MIKSLQINNYQSHEDTFLEFNSGVNVIVGSSRGGKTAILRALRWNRDNKPAGLAINSYWNRDKKKNPINLMKSVVTFSDNSSVARCRDSKWNAYELNENETYEAIKDFPEQVNVAWNMSEVNFQKQFSQPFLLSESSADVARFFNKIINLDKIDVVLSKAENKRIETNKQIKVLTRQIAAHKEDLKTYEWVKRTDELIGSAIIRESAIEELISERDNICKLVESVTICKKEIENIPENIEEVFSLMQEAESVDDHVEELIREENSLIQLREEINNKKEEVEIFERVNEIVKGQIEAIEKQAERVGTLKVDVSLLDRFIEEVYRYEDELEGAEKMILDIEALMPDTCPYCGGVLK